MIPEAQIARLVALYSEFHQDVIKAEKQFFELLRTLHSAHAPDLSYDDFRRYAVGKASDSLAGSASYCGWPWHHLLPLDCSL
ncbi:MAG: hypothetical protein C5B50_08340 [Verrucomicrobia bacterium]|nr:MAG: hypothetical protein C5B50_08340 [Verrucomicrobiota bacterium]